jgi:ribosomal protein S18 acetylase RimI-like enzyme
VAGGDVITWGRERARVAPWRGERDVAYLAPAPDAPLPSPDFVRHCVDTLGRRGFRQVLTSALSATEQAGFLAVGFEVCERLHVLEHDLLAIPDAPELALRRATRKDRPDILSLDGRAFPPFWQMDERGLEDALAATPATRFRVAEADAGETIAGYAICGRAGRHGYVQRLAVDPARHGAGIGRALVVDGLRWMRRWGVDRAVVNTQLDNERALTLYQTLGFRLQPAGLSVLQRGIPS